VRDAVEARKTRQKNLAVILETDGGYAEVVERIVRVFRKHYERVEFIVPNYAMSAGTVLVMSGDSIRMDYYSILGPIDPQVPRRDGNGMVPALGYLAEYNRLIAKSAKGTLTTAEMAFLVEKFDPAELHDYKQARELSISLLKEWLVQYKFRDWRVTETNKTPVTEEMKTARAEEIARALNKTTRWHSHGRGIPMATVRNELKLKIKDIADDQGLSDRLKPYHTLLKHFMEKVGSIFVIHTPGAYMSLPE
jgi:membrane-bound ClpP family serine protease